MRAALLKVKQYTIMILTKRTCMSLAQSSELADSQRELDRHALACRLNKVRALRHVIVTSAECSYASNETETVAARKSLCRTSERESFFL